MPGSGQCSHLVSKLMHVHHLPGILRDQPAHWPSLAMVYFVHNTSACTGLLTTLTGWDRSLLEQEMLNHAPLGWIEHCVRWRQYREDTTAMRTA